MLDKSSFGAAAEMEGLTLNKVPEVSLVSETFCTYILISCGLDVAAAKRSVSNTFSLLIP